MDVDVRRVVIFIRNVEGGVATYVRNFLRYRTRGEFSYKLVLVTDVCEEEHLVRVSCDMDADEICEFRIGKFENMAFVLGRMAKLIESPKDIIWANERTELSMVNLMKLSNPLVHVVHGDSPYYYNSIRDYCGIVNLYLCASDFIAQRAAEIVRNSKSKAKVSKVFSAVPDLTPLKDLKFQKPLRLVYVGRIEEAKGSHLLSGILGILDSWGLDYRFSLIGTGEMEHDLREIFSGNPKVHFYGHLKQRDVFEHLGKQHVLLFPSLSEAVGLVVVEAMKMGVVPITTDLESGLPEIVEEGISGFRVELGNMEGFAKKIREVALDEELFIRLRNGAIRVANIKFNPYKQSDAIVDYMATIENLQFEKSYFDEKFISRLDSKIVPNIVTIVIRRLREIISKLF